MAEKSKSGRGCLKTGCLGCVILVGLGLAGIAGLAGITAMNAGAEPEFVQERLSQQPPPGLASPAALRDAGALAEGQPLRLPEEQVGLVELDLSYGRFIIEPGPAGEPIRVEGDFDTSTFKLEERVEEGDDGWSYRIKFGARRGFSSLMGRNANNEVRVILPADLPIRLVGEVSMGESQIELGGLAIQSMDLETGMGDHSIYFSRPLSLTMTDCAIRGSMGRLVIDELGNASPERLEAKHRMGELELDLSGYWRNDGAIRVRHSMGGVDIRVPDDVAVNVTKASVAMGGKTIDLPEETPAGATRIEVDAGVSMGELIVR